jgi:hypothetical protein
MLQRLIAITSNGNSLHGPVPNRRGIGTFTAAKVQAFSAKPLAQNTLVAEIDPALHAQGLLFLIGHYTRRDPVKQLNHRPDFLGANLPKRFRQLLLRRRIIRFENPASCASQGQVDGAPVGIPFFSLHQERTDELVHSLARRCIADAEKGCHVPNGMRTSGMVYKPEKAHLRHGELIFRGMAPQLLLNARNRKRKNMRTAEKVVYQSRIVFVVHRPRSPILVNQVYSNPI